MSLRISRETYRGSNSSLRAKAIEYNRTAALLENHVNEQFTGCPNNIQQFFYGSIAREMCLSEELVCEILFGVDCGHNGLTVFREHERTN